MHPEEIAINSHTLRLGTLCKLVNNKIARRGECYILGFKVDCLTSWQNNSSLSAGLSIAV